MKLHNLFLSAVLASGVAFAHQVVSKKVGNNYELGFWAHDGFEKYEKSQVLDAKAYDINGKSIRTGIDFKKSTPQVLTDKEPALMVTAFDAKYWTQTTKGYVNTAPDNASGIVFNTLKSIKIGKTYYKYSQALSQPLGLELEVSPLVNPLELKVGDTLPVLVTYQGKPLANAHFEDKHDEIDPVTNDYGIAFIKIKEKGLNIFAARYSYPHLLDNKAQKVLLESSIDFEVK